MANSRQPRPKTEKVLNLPTSTPLPLREVVLFSSGVGYFQRSGKINGGAVVDLSFRTDQVNDILKSLVLSDPTGSVQPVTYAPKDSLTRRLDSMGLSIHQTVSLGGLLCQFQGARIRLETGGAATEGRLLSVSTHRETVEIKWDKTNQEGVVKQVELVNVLTESGLRAVSLEQVTQIQLLDEPLDQELRESLELLATGLGDQQRLVQLHFGGDKAREVRAGYLQEMPVWKTGYRLVLDKKQPPYLQGWAIVENTTEEDWHEVRLSLVSGRPVSFIQELYQPIYLTRPTVEPQIVGAPTSELYESAMPIAGGGGMMAAPSPAMASAMITEFEEAIPQSPPSAPAARSLKRAAPSPVTAQKMAQSVVPQAQNAERGDLFEYVINQPVTLPRQQAAMVPIIGQAIEGKRIAIYNASGRVAQAMSGFRLKNNSKLHLSGGPITVFQDGIYAGDAQINHVQPGEERLISYAVDLDLTIVPTGQAPVLETTSITARHGVLLIERKQRKVWDYSLGNKSDGAKTVLVQQMIEPEFQLVEPTKLLEQTADEYRFEFEVPAKRTVELKVVMERPVTTTIALLNADINTTITYTQTSEVSKKLKSALQDLVRRKRKISEVQEQSDEMEQELEAIDNEQTRIRENMNALDHNNPLYQQYVQKLSAQETRIEELRQQLASLRRTAHEKQQELQDFVDNLTVD
ncbi:MAG: hypothetical protein JO316_14820 [Abitibacteriaceae bacterium]|nr:hypothetical protein [Abditibacteriaceae bacterium]MBV9866625.1 hypothetical protein [Abditibacteriaceae bacterium]